MSTNFPTSLDTLTNPTATDSVATVSHASQHANANDALEALEAKVGINNSAVTTSHDYKLSAVTTTAKAVSTDGNQSIAGTKTFSDAGGVVATSPKIITGINDTNGNELLKVTATSSAVNEVTLANGATGANPNLSATGDDANIGLDITPKGTGSVNIRGNSTQAGTVKFYEDTDDGSNFSAFRGSARSGDITYLLPNADPTSGQFLTATAPSSNISTLSWGSPSGATMVSYLPQPLFGLYTVGSEGGMSATVAYVGAFNLPAAITVNKISFNVSSHTTNGVMRVGVYSEDGQTKEIDVTSGTITGTGVVTVSVSAVTLSTGNHYIAMVGDGTVNVSISTFIPSASGEISWSQGGVSSEPIYSGTVSTTGGNLPSTITPGSISVATTKEQMIVRLDN